MQGFVLDELDLSIIRHLSQDARLSFASLGERVGLSKTPCWNRVNRLQKAGVIKGFSLLIDYTKIGLEIRALVQVVVEFSQYQAFEKAVKEHDSIFWCRAITGEFDYVMEVMAPSISLFDELLRAELSGLPGVHRFTTSISTREIK